MAGVVQRFSFLMKWVVKIGLLGGPTNESKAIGQYFDLFIHQAPQPIVDRAPRPIWPTPYIIGVGGFYIQHRVRNLHILVFIGGFCSSDEIIASIVARRAGRIPALNDFFSR